MIKERLYQVILLDGSSPIGYFDTRQEAVRAHRGNISKLVEVIPKATKKSTAVVKPTDEALLISKRSNDDLKTSLGCGYSVTYNCPKADRLYEGMRYLEVSDDQVLEAHVSRIERYEKSIHHHWKGPGLKPNKEWAWAIFHVKGELVSRAFAQEKYSNSLKGTQGGISYIKI